MIYAMRYGFEVGVQSARPMCLLNLPSRTAHTQKLAHKM